MTRKNEIGFSQRVRLEWLDRTAAMLMAGKDRAGIVVALQELLGDKISIGGSAERGNREKAISILLRIWVTPAKEITPLRDEGLEHLQRLSRDGRLVVHWGMAMAAYPFWGVVAETTGRLLRLQASATSAQVQRRVREQLGERETVARAARRVLRCFIDWGVLQESGIKGEYAAAPQAAVDEKIAAWLVEAALVSRGAKTGTVRDILQSPALFPFRVSAADTQRLSENPRIEFLRQGLDEEVVGIRR